MAKSTLAEFAPINGFEPVTKEEIKKVIDKVSSAVFSMHSIYEMMIELQEAAAPLGREVSAQIWAARELARCTAQELDRCAGKLDGVPRGYYEYLFEESEEVEVNHG